MPDTDDDPQYSQLFNMLPTPHIIFKPDKDLTIFDQNEAHATSTLVKREEVIGKPLLSVYPDTTKKYVTTGISDLVRSIRKVARDGKPDSMPPIKYDLKNSDGTIEERWWKLTHYPIFNKDKKVVLVFQATEDITEQVGTASQLARAKASLESASDLGLVSLWSWDIKQDLVYGDANFAASVGIDFKTIQAGLPLQALIDIIHPDDRQYVSDSISDTVKHKRPYNIDYRFVASDGKVTSVVARGKVTYDVEGKPARFDGILFDITERKKIETLLRASERRFNALFDSNILAIVTMNTAGEVLQANQTFLKLFGYNKTDLKKGISSSQISQVSNDHTTVKILLDLQEKGESDPVRKDYKRKDGSQFTGLVGTVMLPDSDSEFVAFILDLTETEKLKELNTVKDEFIAMASHQLRTPVSTVKQYLGVLIAGYAGDLTDAQLNYVKTAYTANEREITIIEDLLKTAQIDVKGYYLNKTRQDLVRAVEKIVTQCNPLLDSRKQQIIFNHDDTPIELAADFTELATSITNLIENASKYSKHEKTIFVTLSHTDKNVAISVTDQGVGIDETDFPKIFQKFTRVNNPLSDTVTGSGLGLYWVKRIAELHGGELNVTSQLGKGSTFTIKLPI